MSYNAKNYREQGGETWIIGGELKIDGGKITPQANAITDATVASGETVTKVEYDAVVTKLNAVLAALRGVGIVKSS